MSDPPLPFSARDPLLFTPGPLTTSKTVKQAMLRDVGSWDREFSQVVAGVRQSLLTVGGVSPQTGLRSGAHAGQRIVWAGSRGDFRHAAAGQAPGAGQRGLRRADRQRLAALQSIAVDDDPLCREPSRRRPQTCGPRISPDPAITHVVVVHCETTSGIQPDRVIGTVVRSSAKPSSSTP